MTKISAFLLSLLVLSSLQGAESVFVGSFRYIKGEVTIESKKDKSTQYALKDMQFFEGDKISTNLNSFAILNFQDGSTIKMDQNSEITIVSLLGKSEKGHFGVSRILLGIGGVMVEVVKRFTGPPSVEIDTTKGMAFGVRGTKFYTFIESDSEDIWTLVLEGQVQAFDFAHDDNEIVQAGTSIVVVDGDRLTIPQEYEWVKKVSWNNDPAKGDLDSGIGAIAQERRSELLQLLKTILNRKRKPFINSEVNPRRMRDREMRQINETTTEENSGATSQSMQQGITAKIKETLQKISEKNPNAPKPIPASEKDGNRLAQDTCSKVAPSGFPCIVRMGYCFGEEISAALFYTPVSVYNVCVRIINGIFL